MRVFCPGMDFQYLEKWSIDRGGTTMLFWAFLDLPPPGTFVQATNGFETQFSVRERLGRWEGFEAQNHTASLSIP